MSSVDEIVQIGNDVTSIKYYWAALSTMLFYDYFLTLQDEVQYVWKGRKSWAFVVFSLNRYLPMIFAIWMIISNLSRAYTYEMCTKTVSVEVFFYVWCTLVAQIVLTARLYAITMRNKFLTGLFVCISAPQFLMGVYQSGLATSEQAQQLLDISLPAYQLCIFKRHGKVEIIYTAISLVYDLLAFLIIVIFVVKNGIVGLKMPRIFRAIIRDATVYFLIISTSHFVFEMTLLLARPNLQLLTGSGNYLFLPVMIGRLVLSLKKAADPSKAAWSLASITHASNTERGGSQRSQDMSFAPVLVGDAV